MTKKITVGALAVAFIAIAAVVGASAYTTGTVSRTATMDVVNDNEGLIALEDGTSGGLVDTSSGQLAIDFTQGGAAGVNADATFELGDPANANESSAFNITNLDTKSHDFTLDYTLDSDDGNTDQNVQLQVYDSTGSEIATFSEEGDGSTTLSGISSGQTVYVVVVVDTNGLTTSEDLSGTLTVSA